MICVSIGFALICEELELTLALGLALDRHVHAQHLDGLVAAQDAGVVSKHDHIVQFSDRGLDHVIVDVRRDGLEDLRGITHQHRQTGGGATCAAKPFGPGDVAGNGRELVADLRELLIYAQQFLGIRALGWKNPMGGWRVVGSGSLT